MLSGTDWTGCSKEEMMSTGWENPLVIFIGQTAVEIRGNVEFIVMKEVKTGCYCDVAAHG